MLECYITFKKNNYFHVSKMVSIYPCIILFFWVILFYVYIELLALDVSFNYLVQRNEFPIFFPFVKNGIYLYNMS